MEPRRGPLTAGEKVQFTDRKGKKITDQLVAGGSTQTEHGLIDLCLALGMHGEDYGAFGLANHIVMQNQAMLGLRGAAGRCAWCRAPDRPAPRPPPRAARPARSYP